ADAADGGGAAVGVGEHVPPAGAGAGGDGAGQFGMHRPPAGENPGPGIRPGHGREPGQQPQPAGPAHHTEATAVGGDGIVVIRLVAGIHRRWRIVASHTVLIGHTSTTRRPVAISVAGPRFTRSTAIGPRPRRHRTVARRHATARLRTAVALIVGFWVVGPRRFRFGAVLVIWP